MTPQIVTERLLARYGEPEFAELVRELEPHLTVEVIVYLKERVDEEKLRDANHALHLATLADALVSQALPTPEAQALAHWAKGSALLHLSDYQESLESYQRAVTIYKTQNEQLSLAGVQVSMVAALRNLGHLRAALDVAQEGRTSCLALGKPAQRYLALLEMNAGVIYRQIGNPEAALQAYQRGRDIFGELGDTIQVARIDINRSNVLQEMSRFTVAQELLHSARHTLVQTGSFAQQVARVDFNLGRLAHQRGQYQEALTYFEAARRGFAGMNTLIAIVDLRRSLIYRKLNLIQETINQALAAEPIFVQNGMLQQEALALRQQGLGYQLAGDYRLAERYLIKARDNFQQQEVRVRVFELDYDLACLAYLMGRFDEVQQIALRLQEQVAADIWPRLAAQARLLLAQCALIDSSPTQACDYAEAALALSLDYSLREPAIAAHYLMGQILESTGDLQTAWSQYQTAMQEIESLRVDLLVDQFRIGFMDDKLPIYADALRVSQQIATPAQLLYTLNLAHTAPLPYLAITKPDEPLDNELQRELNTQRERWHWYQNKLEEATNDAEASDILTILREVEAKLADLTHRWHLYPKGMIYQTSSGSGRAELTTSIGDARDIFSPDAADRFLVSLQDSLESNEALLHYYVVNDTFQVLLITKDGIHLQPNLAASKSLQRLLSGWRFHLSQTHQISQSPQASRTLAQRYLRRFYQALVAPLAANLANLHHLFVVMPPAWHDLPFNAFFDGQEYLVEHYQVTYLSAPEVLGGMLRNKRQEEERQNQRQKATAGQALIVGHSDQGKLPGILRATHRVAKKLSTNWSTTVLVDAQASFDNFQAASQQSHLIHLATHATFRADNPLFSWARLAEHRLTVAELYQIKLPQNPLVVLSACETGQGQARGGGLLGMGRALLAAGASGVVVTLWRVEDQATAQLMVDFYDLIDHEQVEGNKPPATEIESALITSALSKAQQQAIARHQHPFFWAGFIFIQG